MGSEQSSHGAVPKNSKSTRIGQLRRGKSVPEPKRPERDSVEGSRPDSPKLQTKQTSHLARGRSLGTNALSSPRKNVLRKNPTHKAHNVIVVKPAAKEETADKDPDIIRLQKIPMFLPIMRGTLNLPAPRDPEILERLDPNALYNLCLKCEKYLHECATQVAGDQHLLALQIKEIDSEVTKIYSHLLERQKTFAKQADSLAKITEITDEIEKCRSTLDTTLDCVQKLNNTLPEDERLEPFVWATG
ncbi:BLOC-1-related complex subunit 5 isoform X2 [Cimex lectularius]|uniref:BLOC-1-related complex subunit 5 n=1 Tax=Cimex lectularius TaxID=79782 RepID=A0A8I6S1Q4_CIMLE|nr:BLOC-1-related complex subunit 5 isoform X2 [Cimex lectularius]